MIDYASKLQYLIVAFLAMCILIGMHASKRRLYSSGLVLAYLMDFALLYLPGALVYSNKWYSPESAILKGADYGPEEVFLGFQMTCFGLFAFCIGILLQSYFHNYRPNKTVQDSAEDASYLKKLAGCYLVAGFTINILLEVVTRNMPSLSMVVSASFKFFIVGLALYMYEAIQSNKKIKFFMIVAIALITLPVYTIISDGFISYAVNAIVPLIGILIIFYRPKWHVIILLIAIGWAGASVYVNYMNVRGDLREAVWFEDSKSKAATMLVDVVSNFEFFDSKNQRHLEMVDARLNQSWLVGRAVQYIENGNIDYAHGKTLYFALIATIPRALWPEKPSYAGSMGIVSEYTGIGFDDATSVGVGQVMEFYVNYGLLGEFFGFLILGLCIAYFDVKAGENLAKRNYVHFVYWFMPGIGFINSTGMIAETVGTIWISLAACVMVNRFIIKKK